MEISTARCKAQNVLGMMFVSCTTYSFRRALCARFKSFLMRYLVSTPISILPQCTCVCVRQTCRVSVLANAGQGHPSQRIRSFPHVPGNFALHIYIPGVHIIFESDPSRLLFSTVTGEQEVILWMLAVNARGELTCLRMWAAIVLITRGVSFVTHNAANPLCELHQCHGSTKHDTSRMVYGEDG